MLLNTNYLPIDIGRYGELFSHIPSWRKAANIEIPMHFDTIPRRLLNY